MTWRSFWIGAGYILMFLAGASLGISVCTHSSGWMVTFLILLVLGNIFGLKAIKST